ncbi:hypothetical protein [Pendulispora albinea]|uniref:Uncharacterized protein n=1 Tax=Pendulispora albinea TaxID=2741071 RepID=A0ABZ2M6X3_9BACT
MLPERPLSAAFLGAAAEPLRAELGSAPWTLEALEKTLGDLVREAQKAYPTIALGAESFVAYVAPRVRSEVELRQLRAGDVYLACALVARERSALQIWESQLVPSLDPALAKMRLAPERVLEVKQLLRAQLLVGEGSSPPRITSFTGHGDLHGWLRVTAVRAALKLLRREKREVLVDGDTVLADRTSGDDPELSYIKEVYRAQFKSAFQFALDSLSDREKNLLRQNIVDGLGIDDLAGLYRAHRATVARWLAAARETLLRRARERFMQHARIGSAECNSILRMVHSQLDGTIRRRLQSA